MEDAGVRKLGPNSSRTPDAVGSRWTKPGFALPVLLAALVPGLLFRANLPPGDLDREVLVDRWMTAPDDLRCIGTPGDQVARDTAPQVNVLGAVIAAASTASILTVMHAAGLLRHMFVAASFIPTACAGRPRGPFA